MEGFVSNMAQFYIEIHLKIIFVIALIRIAQFPKILKCERVYSFYSISVNFKLILSMLNVSNIKFLKILFLKKVINFLLNIRILYTAWTS